MLLAVYGVRAGEVARLQLDHIDWERETIDFTRSKLLGSHSFPLCQTVGEAIIRYLKEARPTSRCREILLTMRAPFRPIRGGALWPVVGRTRGADDRHQASRPALATARLRHPSDQRRAVVEGGRRSSRPSWPGDDPDLRQGGSRSLREVASFDLGGLL